MQDGGEGLSLKWLAVLLLAIALFLPCLSQKLGKLAFYQQNSGSSKFHLSNNIDQGHRKRC